MEATLEAWVYDIASVLFMSGAPVLLLNKLPIDHRVEHQLHRKKLLALAAGCLLSNAFLHLIPQSRDTHPHDPHDHGHGHGHSHDMSGLKIFFGIFIMEKFIKIIKPHLGHDHENKKNDDCQGIHVSGWLNLAADLHNFTDGLTIGASFLAGNKVGLGTAFATFFHELSHEIGDYVRLIQSVCTKKAANLQQLGTAVATCFGIFLCFWLGTLDEEVSSVLQLAAGTYIYLAAMHLLPQLNNSGSRQTVWESAGLVGEVGIMYLIIILE